MPWKDPPPLGSVTRSTRTFRCGATYTMGTRYPHPLVTSA